MPDSGPGADGPSRRILLLGASNLIRGISTVVEMSRQRWGVPLDVVAALGHGRSYGLPETRVLARSLPGILSSGIWNALSRRPQIPTASLLTDIGNDILYGVSADQISAWIERCLMQVAEFAEQIVVTELPLDSIRKMGPKKFFVLRSVFFPRSRLQFVDAMTRAEQLNEQVLKLADQFNAIIVKPNRQWYGFDPIHIKTGKCPAAWREIISAWRSDQSPIQYAPSIRRWVWLHNLRPEKRRMFGIVQQRSQPAARLPDGTCVSFY